MPKHHFTISELNKLGLYEVTPGVFKKSGLSPNSENQPNKSESAVCKKKYKKKGTSTYKLDPFIMFVKQELNIELVPEVKFHSSRKWRFDYAIPDKKIAIECEGGIWTRGRHTRGKGYKGDMEKYNAAVELGWKLLRFTPDELLQIETINKLKTII